MKKIFSVLLLVTLMLSFSCINAFAESHTGSYANGNVYSSVTKISSNQVKASTSITANSGYRLYADVTVNTVDSTGKSYRSTRSNTSYGFGVSATYAIPSGYTFDSAISYHIADYYNYSKVLVLLN